jgi:hypothetical protein
MTETRKLHVFLCHSSQDKPIVRELYQRLLTEGWIDPWLDEEKLLPGMDWDLEIEKAVESADAVIVCLSNNSITKEGYVQRELKFALDIALEKPEGTVFVIPLRIDSCEVPRRIRSWQFVDYFPENRKDWSYNRLLKSLKLRTQKIDISIFDVAEEKILANQRKKFDVFLCHKSEDKMAVKAIAEKLKKHGLTPWLREWELRPGIPWTVFLKNK